MLADLILQEHFLASRATDAAERAVEDVLQELLITRLEGAPLVDAIELDSREQAVHDGDGCLLECPLALRAFSA